MARNARSLFVVGGLGLMVAGYVAGTWNSAEGQTKAEADPALERAREKVRMLDDIHKTAVVAITDKYVHKDSDIPAIAIAGGLFGAMKSKGWYESKLIDASGQPYNEKNLPSDDFEKAAVKSLVGGKDYYEQVVTVDGKKHLRAATPVPVVMKKCTMCHDNYKEVKEGVPIGVLTYDVLVK